MYIGPTTCKVTQLGTEYVGTLNVTVSGRCCQPWTSSTPHAPFSGMANSDFPDGSKAAALNYCRNPDSSPNGPWCYTMDPGVAREYCSIFFCRESATLYFALCPVSQFM